MNQEGKEEIEGDFVGEGAEVFGVEMKVEEEAEQEESELGERVGQDHGEERAIYQGHQASLESRHG